MKFYIYIFIIFLVSCKKPNDPMATDHLVSFVTYLNTYGEALDTDLTENNMVVAANYKGFIVYDLERNVQGHIMAIDSVYNDSDMDDFLLNASFESAQLTNIRRGKLYNDNQFRKVVQAGRAGESLLSSLRHK